LPKGSVPAGIDDYPSAKARGDGTAARLLLQERVTGNRTGPGSQRGCAGKRQALSRRLRAAFYRFPSTAYRTSSPVTRGCCGGGPSDEGKPQKQKTGPLADDPAHIRAGGALKGKAGVPLSLYRRTLGRGPSPVAGFIPPRTLRGGARQGGTAIVRALLGNWLALLRARARPSAAGALRFQNTGRGTPTFSGPCCARQFKT